jgi:hypothetical protein
MTKAIRELKLLQIDIPTYPMPTGGAQTLALGESYIWQQDVAEAKKKIAQLKENKKRVYALIIGQCLPELEGKIQGIGRVPRSRRGPGCCEAAPGHPWLLLPLRQPSTERGGAQKRKALRVDVLSNVGDKQLGLF